MSRVRTDDDKVIAILTSDCHFTKTPPILRSAEPSWYDAMLRPINELRALRTKHNAPIIIAGDITHHSKEPPELINFLLANLPNVHAIPGQHDLPLHNYQDIKKSAYWTLVAAGVIHHLEPGKSYPMDGMVLHPFPWEHKVTPCKEKPNTFGVHVAVIHAYIWTKDNCYPGAPKQSRLKKWKDRLRGYDVAVFGDNHKGFLHEGEDIQILNCGGLMRRRADEIRYKPSVGLLYADGHIKRHFLDCSQDQFADIDSALEIAEKVLDMTEFVESMGEFGGAVLDFVEVVGTWLNKEGVDKKVKKIVLQAMEERHGK